MAIAEKQLIPLMVPEDKYNSKSRGSTAKTFSCCLNLISNTVRDDCVTGSSLSRINSIDGSRYWANGISRSNITAEIKLWLVMEHRSWTLLAFWLYAFIIIEKILSSLFRNRVFSRARSITKFSSAKSNRLFLLISKDAVFLYSRSVSNTRLWAWSSFLITEISL